MKDDKSRSGKMFKFDRVFFYEIANEGYTTASGARVVSPSASLEIRIPVEGFRTDRFLSELDKIFSEIRTVVEASENHQNLAKIIR